MPRNMSFMLTTEQVRNRIKRVTRRNGWLFLRPGDIVNAVEKGMGLKKGEKVKRICQIKVISVNLEPLNWITKSELILEGFPDMTTDQFIDMYCKHNKCKPRDTVNRIEFEYI